MVQRKLSLIPTSIPNLLGNEKKYLKDCIDSNYVASSGKYLNLFKKKISKHNGGGYVTLTSSGSTALHLALISLKIKKGDLVFVPSYTFIATVNAIKLAGAEPFFVDISEKSLNLDEELLEKIIRNDCFLNSKKELIYKKNKKRISSLLTVFSLGLPSNMKFLKSLCIKYNLNFVVDAACAIGSKYMNLKLSRMGADFYILSFNANKIITSGGGGALITSKKTLYNMSKLLSSNAKKHPDKYEFDKIGYNYRMNNIQAAVGLAQIENLKLFLKKKKFVRNFYEKYLQKEINKKYLKKLPELSKRESSNWLSGFIVNKGNKNIRNFLKKKNIQSGLFWKPCHLQVPYKNSIRTSMKITEKLWKKILILPSSTSIKNKDLNFVAKNIRQYFTNLNTR